MRIPAQVLDFSRENLNFNSVGFLLVCEGERGGKTGRF